MKYTLKTAVMILCILLASGLLYGQNGQEKKRKNVEKPPNNLGAIRQAIVVDRDMLNVYTRMMRYQTAWRDITNQALGNETTPDDYLTIAIRNVEVGDLKNLSNYLKMIKQPSSDVLAINREMRCEGGGKEDCELAYDVRWAKEGAKYGLKFNMPNTGNVDHYLTYDVTVEYNGKSLTHGGVIVHYRNKNAGFMIYDGIIPQIDDLILDKLPLMVEKRRMSRVFSDTLKKAKVKELPPAKVWSKLPEEENIIGWLPSDELELEEWEDMPIMMTMMTMAAANPIIFHRTYDIFNTSWWGGVKLDTSSFSGMITAVENCNTNKWEPEITALSVSYRYFARLLPGVEEASVQNMNQNNYCAMIGDLSQPVYPEANVSVAYYVLNAIEAHENTHVSQLESSFNSGLSSLSYNLINALSIPLSSASNSSAATAIMQNNYAFVYIMSSWYYSMTNAWTALGEGAAQNAENDALISRKNELRSSAQMQPWYPGGVPCF